MKLLRCNCGLLTNEVFKICPLCGSKEKQNIESVYDLNKEVFTLTMEDVISVIKEAGLEEEMSKFSEKEVMDMLRHKMDIPWTEYVEVALQTCFIDK